MHPIDFFYQHSSKAMEAELLAGAVNASADDVCAACMRPASSWIVDKKHIFSNYGIDEAHCLPCHSLYHGSLIHLGMERTAGGGAIKVPGKLGMLSSCAKLISSRQPIIYTGASYLEKLGHATQPFYRLVEATGLRQILALIKDPPEPPFIFISDLGRKKPELIANLRVTKSLRQTYLCSADEIVVLDIPQLRAVQDALAASVPHSDLSVIQRWGLVVRGVAQGRYSPSSDVVTDLFDKNPELIPATKLLPADPYSKQLFTQLITAQWEAMQS